MKKKFSNFDLNGNAIMFDTSEKNITSITVILKR